MIRSDPCPEHSRLTIVVVIDSVEAGGPRWVRSTGWPQAWEDVPDRSVASNGH